MWNDFLYEYTDKNTFCEPEVKNISSGRNFEVLHYRQIEVKETEVWNVFQRITATYGNTSAY